MFKSQYSCNMWGEYEKQMKVGDRKMRGIDEIDQNLAVTGTIGDTTVHFFNVRQKPFRIYGLLAGNAGEPFRRLPLQVAEQVSEGVKNLHSCTAGGRVRFRTNSDYIAIRAVMPGKELMPQMSFLGSSGFDLYETVEGVFCFLGSFAPPIDREGQYESMVRLEGHRMRDLTIHFPLYDRVRDLFVGVEPGASLEEGGCYQDKPPILYYGSSITQGGCASRPGNCYTNLITARLNIDHVNLGFSGNGKGERTIAEYIAEQPMSLFFCDYDYNAPSAEYLEQTHEAFFLTIREKNPDLPVILASRALKLGEEREITLNRRAVILKTYENALKRGDRKIRFVDGMTMFDEAGRLDMMADSCTVDGVHPNDLGFACMAKVFGRAIAEMLG